MRQTLIQVKSLLCGGSLLSVFPFSPGYEWLVPLIIVLELATLTQPWDMHNPSSPDWYTVILIPQRASADTITKCSFTFRKEQFKDNSHVLESS